MPITPSLRHCSNKYKLAREGEKDKDFEKSEIYIYFFITLIFTFIITFIRESSSKVDSLQLSFFRKGKRRHQSQLAFILLKKNAMQVSADRGCRSV